MSLMKKTNLSKNRLEENIYRMGMISKIKIPEWMTDTNLKNEFRDTANQLTREVLDQIKKSDERELIPGMTDK